MNEETRIWLRKRRLRSGKTSYHARWIDPATRRWRSRKLGTDRRLAEHEALRLETELRQGSYGEFRRVPWGDFVAEHTGRLSGVVNAADAKRTLKEFGSVCGPLSPDYVTFGMIETFVEHPRTKGNSVATRNKRLRYLRAAFNKGIKRGCLTRNPMDAWQWDREEQKIPRVLSEAEKVMLLDACPTELWRTFVYVALTTGCRRGELLGLEWSRVNFDEAYLVVTGTKARRDRVQPLNPEAVAMLRKLQVSTLKGGGPFASFRRINVANWFRNIVTAAAIDRCTIHDLRRTFCTDLARLGVNQLVVQKLAGHASASTTARYYQLVDDSMKREAVAKLGRRAG